MTMTGPYDPLDYGNLARSIVQALLEREPAGLPPAESFAGSGVYALYYTGALEFYAPISSADLHTPIYVGKADRRGGRKGSGAGESSAGTELFNRLQKHASSIDEAENLGLTDFRCRYLTVVPVWITLAERFLIDHFTPAWNTVIDGFGNHDPGSGRRNSRRPRWDIVHPGRSWAKKLVAQEKIEDIIGLLPS